MSESSFNLEGARQTEESYFRRKELELIDKLKQKAAREAERKALSEAVGVSDEGILQTLEEMGFDREVVIVLHLFPVVAVAWADGEISPQERNKIIEAARAGGVHEGTPADQRLQAWLTHRPDESMTRRVLRVIRDIAQFRVPEKQSDYRSDILALCEAVAESSGGFLGVGWKVSAAEREVIQRVVRELADNHRPAADRLLGGSK